MILASPAVRRTAGSEPEVANQPVAKTDPFGALARRRTAPTATG
jgi:hypothetical protein